MGKTDRVDPPGRRMNKEQGWVRRITRRIERHNTRAHINHERYDDADTRQIKGTEGWITS